ncbi:hypothetical protein PRIPAC_82524, partial [Pristionchus pacificus]
SRMSNLSLVVLLLAPLLASAFILAPMPGVNNKENAHLQAAINKFNAAVAAAGDNYENSTAVHNAFKNMITASLVYASTGAMERRIPAGVNGGKNALGTVGTAKY